MVSIAKNDNGNEMLMRKQEYIQNIFIGWFDKRYFEVTLFLILMLHGIMSSKSVGSREVMFHVPHTGHRGSFGC